MENEDEIKVNCGMEILLRMFMLEMVKADNTKARDGKLIVA